MRRKSRASVARHLRQRPGQLHARRSGADHDEGQQPAPPPLLLLALGGLEGQQHPPPDVEGVLQALEAGGMGRPVVVAEVRVRGARGHDQEVVGQLAVGEPHALAGHVDARGLGHQHRDVALPPEDAPDRRRDRGRRQPRHRDLVEQRLEHVVVATVDERHAHGRAPERPGGLEAAEAAAQDHDARPLAGHGRWIVQGDPATSFDLRRAPGAA
jgi:hypothetical protein